MPDAPASSPYVLTARQRWAQPGGRHDWTIWILRRVLPATIGALSVALVAAPLIRGSEVSFVLAKDTVAMATERLRVTAALYRGEDSKGQPFALRAGSAVQTSSRDPVVRLKNLQGEIRLADGPAMISANNGRYDMSKEIVNVDGPVNFTTSDGYKLSTRDVAISLKSRKLASGGAVSGRMPIGSFSAGRIVADLPSRTVILDGGAKLRIDQGAL
jgi:lipopolysaccharide export system protein LptC